MTDPFNQGKERDKIIFNKAFMDKVNKRYEEAGRQGFSMGTSYYDISSEKDIKMFCEYNFPNMQKSRPVGYVRQYPNYMSL